MRVAAFPWKIQLMLQIIISVNICFMNALLCAAQSTGFDMLMSSLVLLALNDIDNIIAKLYYIISGINLDDQAVTALTNHDFFFSKMFAVPHILWISYYSFCFLGFIQINDPPGFVKVALLYVTIGTVILLTIWYIVCYSKHFE